MRRTLAATAAALVLGCGVPQAVAQTWRPSFDILLSGQRIATVTTPDTIDYGSHPPASGLDVSLHNGGPVECMFTATTGTASQYARIGGSIGWNPTSGTWTEPALIHLALPVPVTWTLSLSCGAAGSANATVSTELPPPPPSPSTSPAAALAANVAPTPSPKGATPSTSPSRTSTSSPAPPARAVTARRAGTTTAAFAPATISAPSAPTSTPTPSPTIPPEATQILDPPSPLHPVPAPLAAAPSQHPSSHLARWLGLGFLGLFAAFCVVHFGFGRYRAE